MKQYILALDQGTSSSRAIIFDNQGKIKATSQKEFTQIFPKPGWVEHNPMEIWSSQASVIAEAITSIGINGDNIAAIGISPTSVRQPSYGMPRLEIQYTTPSYGRTEEPQSSATV